MEEILDRFGSVLQDLRICPGREYTFDYNSQSYRLLLEDECFWESCSSFLLEGNIPEKPHNEEDPSLKNLVV